MENYCLYCSNRGCNCSMIEEPAQSNCVSCGNRKCRKNPLKCKVEHLNMDYYKINPNKFIEQVLNIKLCGDQEQILNSLFRLL